MKKLRIYSIILASLLTWEKGRQRKSFDSNTYTYNANGIRTGKTVDGIQHDYILDGATILRETWNGNTLIPLYDNEDSVCGIIYNKQPFYFQKNLQGDIIAIVNKNTELVARYSYDAWGVCTILSDSSDCSIATINPFRYRGYYYDEETELYYLLSRYYDPHIGRFVNSDDAEIVAIEQNVLMHNQFVYCENKPIDRVDDSGLLSFDSIKKSINKFISNLFNQFKKYIANLIRYNNRVLSIKTVVISAAIDSLLFLLGSVASFFARKAAFKLVKLILFKNKKTTVGFMKWLIELWQKINVVRLVLWAISVRVGTQAVKVKSFLSDFTENLIGAKSRIADWYFKIISLASFSGIIAFLLDIMDGKPDGTITIKV